MAELLKRDVDRLLLVLIMNKMFHSEKSLVKTTRIPVISTGKKYYREPY